MPNQIHFETKRLRSCTARVHKATTEGGVSYLLESYNSNVVETFLHPDGVLEITLLPRWNYSRTTQYHVRAFLADYLGIRISVSDLRNAFAQANANNGYTTIQAQGYPDWHRHRDVVILGEKYWKSARAIWFYNSPATGYWGF